MSSVSRAFKYYVQGRFFDLPNRVNALEHQSHALHQLTRAGARQMRRWLRLAAHLIEPRLRSGRATSGAQMRRCTYGLRDILAMGMAAGWITTAAGQSVSCGDTLGPGEEVLLQGDLMCVGVSPALTLRDGARLDLGAIRLPWRGLDY